MITAVAAAAAFNMLSYPRPLTYIHYPAPQWSNTTRPRALKDTEVLRAEGVAAGRDDALEQRFLRKYILFHRCEILGFSILTIFIEHPPAMEDTLSHGKDNDEEFGENITRVADVELHGLQAKLHFGGDMPLEPVQHGASLEAGQSLNQGEKFSPSTFQSAC